RKPGNAGAGMDRDSGKIVTDELAFPGMQSTAHVELKRAQRVADRTGTTDRPCRPVKCGEEAVSRGVYLATAVLFQHFAYLDVKIFKELSLCPATECTC